MSNVIWYQPKYINYDNILNKELEEIAINFIYDFILESEISNIKLYTKSSYGFYLEIPVPPDMSLKTLDGHVFLYMGHKTNYSNDFCYKLINLIKQLRKNE